MNLTAKLKQWARNELGIAANASDTEFKQALSEALVDGTLTGAKFAELSTTKEDEAANEFSATMSKMADSIEKLAGIIEDDQTNAAEKAAADLAAAKKAGEKAGEDHGDGKAMHCECGEKLTQKGDGYECSKCGKTYDAEGKVKKAVPETRTKSRPMNWLEKAFVISGGHSEVEDDGEKGFSIRVKEAAEAYDATAKAMRYPAENRKGVTHALAGQPVRDLAGGQSSPRALNEPSERDKAVSGAFAMFEVNRNRLKSRTLAFQQLPQHAKELLCWSMENEKWGGASDGSDYADIKDRKLTLSEQKALIDDSSSGGIEAAPIVFDDQVIETPLLFGELYPQVNVVPIDRGRRVEGVVTGTVTGGWGGVDDDAIDLFTTTSYVSAFDNTIHRWEGAIRIGLDFLSDTPIDFGQHVTRQYGERLLEDLDDVIATGDGSTQPEGCMIKSGATSVTFSGSTSIGAYESLRFSVPKNEHRATVASSAVFCGTETSYQRARAIAVGGTDVRRLAGMDYSSYKWMERPFKINESLTNQQLFYTVLARYRMYRRRGFYMRTSTEGDTLTRNNEMLMVAMARYGGAAERGAVIGRTTDAPA